MILKNTYWITIADIEFNDHWIVMYLKLLILMYIHDTVIVADSVEGIKHALRLFENYCKDRELKVKCGTTKVVIFGRERSRWKVIILNLRKEMWKQ